MSEPEGLTAAPPPTPLQNQAYRESPPRGLSRSRQSSPAQNQYGGPAPLDPKVPRNHKSPPLDMQVLDHMEPRMPRSRKTSPIEIQSGDRVGGSPRNYGNQNYINRSNGTGRTHRFPDRRSPNAPGGRNRQGDAARYNRTPLPTPARYQNNRAAEY